MTPETVKELIALAQWAGGERTPGEPCRTFVSGLAGKIHFYGGSNALIEFSDAIGMPHLYASLEEEKCHD